MTSLNLDVAQRVNVIGLISSMEWPGIQNGWDTGRLLNELKLTDEEREACGWEQVTQEDGKVYARWQNNGVVRQFDLCDEDIQRIYRAADSFKMIPALHQSWWEPLVAQLIHNGSKAALNGAAK